MPCANPGDIVVAGVKDSSKPLPDELIAQFRSCGAALIKSIGLRESWAFIGAKGLEAGEAVEDHGSLDKEVGECNTYSPRATSVLEKVAVSLDAVDYIALHGDIAIDIPRTSLELYLDASHYSGTGAWTDSSGKVGFVGLDGDYAVTRMPSHAPARLPLPTLRFSLAWVS